MEISTQQLEYVVSAGLFDEHWYQTTYAADINSNLSPLTDYFMFGSAAGRRPNRQFDPSWYRSSYQDVAVAGLEPLIHYAFNGAREGRAPSPCFDASFYGLRVGLNDIRSIIPLQHFLRTFPEFVNYASEYNDWIFHYDTLTESCRKAAGEAIERFSTKPLFSVIVPVYETPEDYLSEAIESVLNQYYPFFELCLVDDYSPSSSVRSVIKQYQRRDRRVKAIFRTENGHISRASNDALSIAQGDYVALLDHDDILRPNALYEVAAYIDKNPDLDILYSDEDKIDLFGHRHSPYFKPDWNEHLLFAQNYVCHLSVYRTRLLRKLGGFRSSFDGSQDYDLILRASQAVGAARIAHVPRILYHWRASPYSTANNSDVAKPYARNAAAAAVLDAVTGNYGVVGVNPSPHPAFHTFVFQTRNCVPGPSLIIGCDSSYSCQDLVNWFSKSNTMCGDNEILMVVSAAMAKILRAPAKAAGIRLIETLHRPDVPANRFELLNAGASAAKGEVLVFLTPSASSEGSQWIADLINSLEFDDVGIAGPAIYSADGSLAGGAYFFSSDEIVVPQYRGFKPGHLGDFGYFGRAVIAQDVGAVAETGLMIKSADFRRLRGFDATRYPRYAAIDLCLKMTIEGKRTIWVPQAKLVDSAPVFIGSAEGTRASQSVGVRGDLERRRFLKAWGPRLKQDPTGNPNLRISGRRPRLAFPPSSQL
jgi:GT2 family glycosyltransferase